MATAMRFRIRPLDVLLAPLRWLEQSRGWRRRLLLLVYLITGGIVGVCLWSMASLNKLPDVGEPFDVAAFLNEANVPDSENAFVIFDRVVKEFGEKFELSGINNPQKAIWDGWSKLDPDQKNALGALRPALELWKQGTKRPLGLAEDLRTVRMDAQTMRRLQRFNVIESMAILEAQRLSSEGKDGEALEWLLAAARSAGHMRGNSRSQWRWYAQMMIRDLTPQMQKWSKNLGVTHVQLKQAIEVLQQIDESTPAVSGNLKADYLSLTHSIGDFPKFYSEWQAHLNESYNYEGYKFALHAYWLFRREHERSRRILNLTFANWLAHCDKDGMDRPLAVGNSPVGPVWGIYPPTAESPLAARSIEPEDLFKWIESTMLIKRLLPQYPYFAPDIRNEHADLGTLIVSLAKELYRRDHNGEDVLEVEDLVPKYLPVLPWTFRNTPAPNAK